MTTTSYPPANRTLQWFYSRYGGSLMKPNCGCLHTTEGTSWPSYSGGAVAPSLTAKPNIKKKKLEWRQHFPLNRSARALVNAPGGVETNTANIIQLELVGTCDPKHKKSWGSLLAGVDYIYWPDAPLWALEDLADLLVWCNKTYGIKLTGPKLWLPYPSSYGASKARMSAAEWKAFYGWCGHEHVTENHHGDPGDLDFAKLITIAKAKLAGTYGKTTTKPTAAKQKIVLWSGATLAAIALAAGVSLPALLNSNPSIKDPAKVKPGQTIILPDGSKKVTAPKTSATPTAKPSAKPTVTATPKPTKSAAPVVTLCAKNKPTTALRVGAKGTEVTRLQKQLKKAGYSQKQTGKYDLATAKNVNKVINKAGNLGRANGIAGPKTRAKIAALAGCTYK